MSENVDEYELIRFQQMVPGAGPETLIEFKACVKSSHFVTSIPMGVGGGLITYFMLPKNFKFKPVYSYFTGVGLYLVGKMIEMQKCLNKINRINLSKEQNRTQPNTNPPFGRNIDQQEREMYSSESANSFMQESSLWNNYDPQFEDTSHEFGDSPDYFKEEESSKKQKVEEKRVTYDDLWAKHRRQQIKDQYSDLWSYTANKSKEAKTVQTRPTEEPSTSDAEYDNKNIWN